MALFGRYCDGQVIFVATQTPRSIGEEVSFTITLAGGEPLIVATGHVEGSYHDDVGPHGRSGMVIRFHDVAAGSRALVDELAAVPAPETGFARGTEPPGMHKHDTLSEVRLPDDLGDSENETRPTGLPRALALARSRAGSGAASRSRPGRDDDPTSVKSIAALARSLVRYSAEGDADGEFDDEAPWSDSSGGEVGDTTARVSRVALRADSGGRPEASSLEALADCTVYEENGACDERGLPTAAPPVARGQEDAWDDDETIPPWLRGPQPDDVMDAPTGAVETDSPIGRIAGRADFHDAGRADFRDAGRSDFRDAGRSDFRDAGRSDFHDSVPIPIPEPTLPPAPLSGSSLSLSGGSLSGGSLSGGSLSSSSPSSGSPSSAGRVYERDARVSVAADPPAAPREENERYEPPPARWPLVLGASLVSAALGLVVGYAVGSDGFLTRAGAEASQLSAGPGTASAAAQPVPGPTVNPLRSPDDPAGEAGDGRGDVGGGDKAAPSADADRAGIADERARDRDDKADEDDERTGRARKGKRAGRERALARDRCGVQIDSDPASSEVVIAGEVVATTPARVELPCGAHEVEVRRSRYQSALRRVRLRPGKLDQVEVRLDRPDHQLRITTAPPGAAVSVNGRAVGTSPVVATVKGYQQIKVRIERSGYEDWSEKVYAREPLTKLTIKLTPSRAAIPASRPTVEPTAPAAPPTPDPATDAGAPP